MRMKTVRFSEVVKASGAPETYVLWTPAKQDKRFQSALKFDRIVTVQQDIIGSKKDFGVVGYQELPNAQLLIFPKSLKRFTDRRIVGMNYELLAKESRVPGPPEKKEVTKKADRRAQSPDHAATPKREKKVAPAVTEKPVVSAEPQAKDSSAAPDKKSQTEWNSKLVGQTLKHALKELRAGKTVAAYERLEKLERELR